MNRERIRLVDQKLVRFSEDEPFAHCRSEVTRNGIVDAISFDGRQHWLSNARCISSRSILRNGRVYVVRPSQDSAYEILDSAVPRLFQELDCHAASDSALAVHDDFISGGELVKPLGQSCARNQPGPRYSRYGVLLGLTNVQQHEVVAFIHLRLELERRYLKLGPEADLFMRRNTAELVVVDQLVNRAVWTANRAVGILSKSQLAKLHLERIEQHKPANQCITFSKDQFYSLNRLNNPDDARQYPQHTTFCATRDKPRRRRLRIEAAIAGSLLRVEHRCLAFKTEDRTVHVGLS